MPKKQAVAITGHVLIGVENADNELSEDAIAALETTVEELEGYGLEVHVFYDTNGAEAAEADEEESEEEGESEEGYSEDELNEMEWDDLVAIAEEWEVEVPSGRGKQAKLVAAILEAQGEDEEGEEEGDDLAALGEAADEEDADAQERLTELAEEVELDPNDYDTWAELAEAIDEASGEGDEEEGDGDEDEEVLDEDALNEMSLPDLKTLAAEYEVKVSKGMKKDALVEAILDAAEAAEE
jgi:hypothetical protein